MNPSPKNVSDNPVELENTSTIEYLVKRRRMLLAGLGAASSGILAACGGGGETAAGSGSEIAQSTSGSTSILASITTSKPLLHGAANGALFQVEIEWLTTAAVRIGISDSLNFQEVFTKPVAQNINQPIFFAQIEQSDLLNTARGLHYGYDIWGGDIGLGSNQFVTEETNPADGANYSYIAHDKNSLPLFRIAFFKLPDYASKFTTTCDGVLFHVISNTSSVRDLRNATVGNRQLSSVADKITDSQRALSYTDAATSVRTLGIPSFFSANRGLIPPITLCDDVAEWFISRHIERHIKRFAGEVVKNLTYTNSTSTAVLQACHSELLNCIGADSLTDAIDTLKVEANGWLQSLKGYVTTAFDNLSKEILLYSAGYADLNRNLASAGYANEIDNKYFVDGFAATTAYQAIFKVLMPMGTFGPVKGGIRLSLPLAKQSYIASTDEQNPPTTTRVVSSWTIGQNSAVKGQIVFILGILPKIDIELTLGFTYSVSKNEIRMDFIQFDPVIDFADQNLLDRLLKAIATQLIKAASATVPSSFAKPLINYSNAGWSGISSAAGSVFGKGSWSSLKVPGVSDSTAISNISSGFTKLKSALNTEKEYSTVELSLLRFVWYSSDTANGVFGSSVWNAAHASPNWIPGIKYITGYGGELTLSPAFTVTGRVVTVADLYATGGGAEIVKYMGGHPDA